MVQGIGSQPKRTHGAKRMRATIAEICRVYRCDRHRRGELGMFFGAECAEVTDMRALAESMARDVYECE